MPEIKQSPLELKLEYIFKQHNIPLPRNLRSSLCGLIATEVTNATCGEYQPTLRDIKMPPLPDRVQNSRYQDE